MQPLRLFLLTLFAMIAFASNSLLCRAALKDTAIDAASFTSIRLASGALVLWIVMSLRRQRAENAGGWVSAFALFVYAAAFSFAYVKLAAGTGALLLFGSVQATMILWGFRRGERLRVWQGVGLALALGGLVGLLLPGLAAPPLFPSVLMLSAGLAWGVYSLRGKNVRDPIGTTAGNFARALPFAVLLSLAFLSSSRIDWLGATFAFLSGGLASGVGYVIWYTALPGLRAASAATVQLSVPVLTTAGGILLLGESVTPRFLFASLAILSGIALVVVGKSLRA